MTDTILTLGFSSFRIDETYYINFLLWYSPIILVQAVLGIGIYKHFCSASVYYFTRIKRRWTWWVKECMSLLGKVIILEIIYVVVTNLIAYFTSDYYVNKAGLVLCIYFLLIFSLWTFIVTCTINVVSIVVNSHKAFSLCILAQLVLIIALLPYADVEQEHELSIKLNPMANLIIYWHSSRIEIVNRYIDNFGFKFDLNWTVAYYLILMIIVVVAGGIVVSKKQFISSAAEG